MTRKLLIYLQILVFLLVGMVSASQAAVVDTAAYFSAQARSESVAQVNALLARDEVRQQLTAFGIDPGQAAERVSALSAEELQLLSQRIDELPAGGSVLGVLGIVFVVLIVLEVVGAINIFSKL